MTDCERVEGQPGICVHSRFTVFQPGGVVVLTPHEQLWTRCYVHGLLCTKPGRGSAYG